MTTNGNKVGTYRTCLVWQASLWSEKWWANPQNGYCALQSSWPGHVCRMVWCGGRGLQRNLSETFETFLFDHKTRLHFISTLVCFWPCHLLCLWASQDNDARRRWQSIKIEIRAPEKGNPWNTSAWAASPACRIRLDYIGWIGAVLCWEKPALSNSCGDWDEFDYIFSLVGMQDSGQEE